MKKKQTNNHVNRSILCKIDAIKEIWNERYGGTKVMVSSSTKLKHIREQWHMLSSAIAQDVSAWTATASCSKHIRAYVAHGVVSFNIGHVPGHASHALIPDVTKAHTTPVSQFSSFHHFVHP